MPAPPSLLALFLAFARIGLTSFGGGLSGWIMRDIVQRRAWLPETEFLTGLALAQSFPGVNVVNLAIWIGFRLQGGAGALAAALGIIVPALVAILLALSVFDRLQAYPATHVVMAGFAAAAIGLSMQMSVRTARRVAGPLVPTAIMALTFVALFGLRLPLLVVVLVAAPLSIAWAWWRDAPGRAKLPGPAA
jgi:chromate transporter